MASVPFTASMTLGWPTSLLEAQAHVKPPPSRISGCSFVQLQQEVEKLTASGLNVHVVPLNIARLSGCAEAAAIHYVYENRNGVPGANFDVREAKSQTSGKKTQESQESSWSPGHAEITAIATSAFDLADLVGRSSKTAVVVCSVNCGDALRTFVACVAAALRTTTDKRQAKLALRGRLPQPRDSKLKEFVDVFATFSRADALKKTEEFYFKEF